MHHLGGVSVFGDGGEPIAAPARRYVVQHRDRLEQRRTLRPRPGLRERPPVPVQGDRCLVRRRPAGQVLPGQKSGVRATGVVHHRIPGEPVDLLGDESGVPGGQCRIDLRLPGGSARCVEQTAVGRGENTIAKKSAGGRWGTVGGEPGGGRSGPMGAEVLGDRGDGRGHPGKERVTVLGVLDGVTEDGVQRLGAVVAQQRQPGAEGAGDRRCEEAGAGHEIQAELLEGLDRRGGGGDPLTGQDDGPARASRPSALAAPCPGREEDGDLSAGAVEVRLDDLEGQPGGDGGVECVAAGLEGRHAGRGGQPVGGGDHAEGAGELGPGGEHLVTVGAGEGARGVVGECAAAGEDAAGGIVGAIVGGVADGMVGVLGISRSTTGGLACCAVRRTAGRPQARYSPASPAPQSANRRTRPRRGARATGAHRQARYSPSGPAPQSAIRRIRDPTGPTGSAMGAGRTGTAGRTDPFVSGREAGAIGIGRSGRARTDPARAAVVRWGRRTGPPSARSSTSIRPARDWPDWRPDRSAGMRTGAGPGSSLYISPPAHVVVRSRGRCCGQGRR